MSLVNFLRVDGAGADVYSFKRNNLLYIPLQTSSQAYLTFLLFKERLESPTGDLDPVRPTTFIAQLEGLYGTEKSFQERSLLSRNALLSGDIVE